MTTTDQALDKAALSAAEQVSPTELVSPQEDELPGQKNDIASLLAPAFSEAQKSIEPDHSAMAQEWGSRAVGVVIEGLNTLKHNPESVKRYEDPATYCVAKIGRSTISITEAGEPGGVDKLKQESQLAKTFNHQLVLSLTGVNINHLNQALDATQVGGISARLAPDERKMILESEQFAQITYGDKRITYDRRNDVILNIPANIAGFNVDYDFVSGDVYIDIDQGHVDALKGSSKK